MSNVSIGELCCLLNEFYFIFQFHGSQNILLYEYLNMLYQKKKRTKPLLLKLTKNCPILASCVIITMFNQQLTVGKFKSNILSKKYETNLVFLSKIKSGSDSLLCNRKL